MAASREERLIPGDVIHILVGLLDHAPASYRRPCGQLCSQYIGSLYSNADAHGTVQSRQKTLFEVRDGGMSEVRSLAEVVNVVRTCTLSAMDKSQTGTMSCYESDVKSDNERDEREYCYDS